MLASILLIGCSTFSRHCRINLSVVVIKHRLNKTTMYAEAIFLFCFEKWTVFIKKGNKERSS